MAISFDVGDSLYNFVVRDGYGVKGMVDLGLDKVPERYIQPPDERIDNLKARSYDRPPIDLSMLDGPRRSQTVELLAEAAETVGFFQVVNHGVPIEVMESVKTAACEFFGQPPEKKAVYRKGVSPTPYVKYGTSFVPKIEKALEWKDFVNMAYTTDADALEFWPNECK